MHTITSPALVRTDICLDFAAHLASALKVQMPRAQKPHRMVCVRATVRVGIYMHADAITRLIYPVCMALLSHPT